MSEQRYETVEVPFIQVDNRRCLTMQQLAEQPWLRDFVNRFPSSFECDVLLCVWWFYD